MGMTYEETRDLLKDWDEQYLLSNFTTAVSILHHALVALGDISGEGGSKVRVMSVSVDEGTQKPKIHILTDLKKIFPKNDFETKEVGNCTIVSTEFCGVILRNVRGRHYSRTEQIGIVEE